MSIVEIRVDASNALKGLEQLVRNAEDSSQIVAEVSREMAEYIVTRAKELVPVDTGILQESIHYEGDYPSFTFVANAMNKGEYYGVYVEYGTSMQSPQPYLEPAVKEGLKEHRAIMKDQIMRFIRGR